ncbi:dual OB domain-containing protein [Bathymodiolus thermophilus thioautotrophic gill symbiont]|uniref:Dual OB-containing domain-containing protein n=1 Tax=Bathymodiolus thermophilus thioautotrophic gill symbiont TaxID=2360 RepID=A0A1J5U831_9GAMM|nr:hypothetical protein [Bathymodiolus thermophilus thioautotrophic gill symbiont]OIR25006.1 hypothetical protein BGC33_05180 [Bathymodiolus thermophilus thioautotrophic gill symbiont]
MNKTLIIFANSVKHKRHCVAGKDVSTKEWIRTVGDKNGCALEDEQTKYQNPYGKYLVKPLQGMNIEFLDKAPLRHQPENYIISSKIWEQKYRIEREEIESFLDNPSNLWLDGISKNDRVKYKLIQNNEMQVTQSLYLIKVNDLKVDKQDRRARFSFNNTSYCLKVTDPKIQYFDNSKKSYYLVISLGEEYKEYCYKIVATIL